MSLILSGALFSIALNPLMFSAIEPLRKWALEKSAFARKLEQREEPFAELPTTTERKFLEKQIVLVGYGRVGQRIAASLTEKDSLCHCRTKQGGRLLKGCERWALLLLPEMLPNLLS